MKRALVALFIVVACSKKEPEPTAAPTPTKPPPVATASAKPVNDAVAKACGAVATSLCSKFAACNTSAMLSIVFDDRNHCVERMKLVCSLEMVAPDVAASVADIEGCAKAIDATSCGDGFDPDDVVACRWIGKRANGAGCGVNAQCTSGFCDKRPPSAECGKCGALPGEGEECPADRCARGFKCAPPGKCVKLVAIGATCDGSLPCASGGFCIKKKCAPPAKLGEKCDPIHTAGPGCAEMISCDVVSKTCRATHLAQLGEMCGLVGTELRPCTRSWCEAHGTEGKCLARVADGDTCQTSESCIVPAACIRGSCRLPDPAVCN